MLHKTCSIFVRGAALFNFYALIFSKLSAVKQVNSQATKFCKFHRRSKFRDIKLT